MRVPLDLPRPMLRDSPLQLVGVPHVVRPVGATQQVDEEWLQAIAFLICSSTSFALAGIGVPGP